VVVEESDTDSYRTHFHSSTEEIAAALINFQTLYADPAEEQGAIWIVVAPAGTMGQLTGYANKSGT
jgi:hypothetical protein